MHLADLSDFTTVFVNQKLRKMQIAVYAIFAPYPVIFLRIKNACLKWSWKQPPRQGWCRLPSCILHRLDEESKYEWFELMLDLEDALLVLATTVSTVVEKSAVAEKDKLKAQAKWLAEAEIELVSCIFAAPKLNDPA